MWTCHRERDRYTHSVHTHTHTHTHTDTHTHTQSYLILHPSEHQRVLFCDPLEFSIPALLLLPAFDLNQRGCDLPVMSAKTYHTAQSVYLMLNIPAINKALFKCVKVVSLWHTQTDTQTHRHTHGLSSKSKWRFLLLRTSTCSEKTPLGSFMHNSGVFNKRFGGSTRQRLHACKTVRACVLPCFRRLGLW